MAIISIVLQVIGAGLIILYFTVKSMSSWFVLVAGIILVLLGYFSRKMRRARLHMAARRGDIPEMKYWLEKGYGINSKRENGLTPLHWAAFKGHMDAVVYLVENGADISARDFAGKTPINHAIDQGNGDVAMFLNDAQSITDGNKEDVEKKSSNENYVEFKCSECEQKLEAPEDMIGEKIDCPACKNELIIPGSSQETKIDKGRSDFLGSLVPEILEDDEIWNNPEERTVKEWFQRKVEEHGDAESQYALALDYSRGITNKQDKVKATELFLKAAEQGHAIAQAELGIAYLYGRGVAQDSTKAIEWFHSAAKQGYADAQVLLGTFYLEGNNVTCDYAEAAEWFSKAAKQGKAEAQCSLGVMYRNGDGVPQNDKKAADFFRKAAEQGHAESQRWLGSMYKKGAGVPKDDNKARLWLKRAAKQGDDMAQYTLDMYFNFDQ